MRTKIFALAAVLMFALSNFSLSTPNASGALTNTAANQTVALAQGLQAPSSTNAAATGWAMGGYPNYWTICATNGVGGTYWPNLVSKWSWAGHKLDLRVQNRCDGYSITNRFTFDYLTSATADCGKITNSHRTWSPARGRYIWDQNPIVWINLDPKCIGTGDSTIYDHHVQMYVGWLLGLQPDDSPICYCVMGDDLYDRQNVRYVVLHDILDMDSIYNH